MDMTEELVSGMVKALKGSYKIQYHAAGPDEPPIEIDFTPPWRRISMVQGLEECLGVKLPSDLDSDSARDELARLVRPIFAFLSWGFDGWLTFQFFTLFWGVGGRLLGVVSLLFIK
jgi:lysyl-tRNA synthetase class II